MAAADTSKRSGKFRHIYGEPAKPEQQFLEIKKPLTSGEGPYVKANDKFFAVSKSSGGGQLYVKRLDQPGRLSPNEPCVAPSQHKGKIWDFDFYPFTRDSSHKIASAGDDCRICITEIPDDGLTENITEANTVLEGHGKKVALVQWHPSAGNILASGGFDRCVKVWDCTNEVCVATYDQLGDNIYSLEWNKDGSQIACTGKDKQLRMFDPRDLDEISCVEAFEGAKSNKCFWLPRFNWVGAVGFSKQAKRQLKIWDLKKLDKPIYSSVLDQAASVLMPHWDDDNSVLYLAGKGEASVSFHEIVDNDRKVYTLGVHRKGEPQKGGGWVPKRGLDVWKCEVQRFMKLTQKSVVPVSIICPRKAGGDKFQDDIYPDTATDKAALDGEDWINGDNSDPLLASLDPKSNKGDSSDGSSKPKPKRLTYKQLSDENAKLKARIAELEGKDVEEKPQEDNEEKTQDDNNDDAVTGDNGDNNDENDETEE